MKIAADELRTVHLFHFLKIEILIVRSKMVTTTRLDFFSLGSLWQLADYMKMFRKIYLKALSLTVRKYRQF